MKYHLTELFDIEELKRLCESFTKLNGTVTAILDLEGNVHIATGWQSLCTQFHRINNETKRLCTESDTILAGQLNQGQKYNVYKCKNGLVDIAMPIMVGDTHVGNFFTGQFFIEKPDIDFFRKQVQKYNFNENDYLSALEKVPIFDENQIKATIEFLVQLTETIGNIGLKNLNNLNIARQLEIEKNNLKKINEEYASLIEEYKIQNEDLQQAKEKTEQSEIEYKSLIENINIGIFQTTLDGKFFLANSSIVKMSGYDNVEEFLTVPSQNLYADNLDRDFMINELKEKGFNKNREIRSIKKNGDIYWISMNSVIIKDSFGNPISLLGAIEDITERKKAERLIKEKNDEYLALNEELRLKNSEYYALNEEYKTINKELNHINEELKIAKEKAEESDRLKTVFLQNISHEIRTPMNAIIGFSAFLDEQDLTIEKRKYFTSIIKNSSYQLLSIVTDILTISTLQTKQEKINIELVCINDIINNLYSIFKTQAIIKNISINVKPQLTDEQTEIFTDNTKLTQILTNLIANALKFTLKGFIEFGYILKDNELEFYVKDSGIGIKTEMQEKIFERFRQANETIHINYGGTGLGLSISKGFVELLGGKIWVQSELEKGSTFYFTIPYNTIHKIEKPDLILKHIDNEKELKTILVAEDDEYSYLFIKELLTNLKIQLIHSKDGKETIEICRTNQNIDLIFMDIKMPIIDGHTAAKLIKVFRPDLPIIAQTAYALDYEKVKYLGKAFDDYISKPIDKNELKQKVMKYINNQ